MGKGVILSSSRKQKQNSRSSTEAELIAADDVVPQILWTQLFLEAQGYPMKHVLNQDNQSAILLETNGKASSSKRTRHFNIRFFYIKDQIDRGLITVRYCPTEEMLADFFTKPMQGEKFRTFRGWVMGHTTPEHSLVI